MQNIDEPDSYGDTLSYASEVEVYMAQVKVQPQYMSDQKGLEKIYSETFRERTLCPLGIES